MEAEDKLQLLKRLLLEEEKEFVTTLAKNVKELQTVLYQKEQLAEKVNPIVDDKLHTFIEEIPATLGPTITQTLKEEIKNSQDAVVEALFPIIGKMIKKYIAHEIRLLSDRINQNTKRAFSFRNWFRQRKAKSTGVSDGDMALSDYAAPRLLQLFVIEKDSGILISEYSLSSDHKVDKEMIAGMLTAIKNFVEDAFQGQDQNLESIEYELYTIHIQNFYSYYIAAVISGAYTLAIKDALEDQILDFAQHQISKKELQDNALFTQKLKNHFTNEIV